MLTVVELPRLSDTALPTVPSIVWLPIVIVPAAIMSQLMVRFTLVHLFADTRTFPSDQVGTDEGVPESMPAPSRVSPGGIGAYMSSQLKDGV